MTPHLLCRRGRAALRGHLRDRPRGEDGLGLAELVVVMVILGLVGTLVMSLSVSTMRILARAGERADDSGAAQVALDDLGRALRAADDPDGAAPLGSACTPTATDGRRCAFLDAGSAYPELRSGASQIAFFSALYDQGPARAGKQVLYRFWVDSAGVLREQVWEGAYTTGTGTLAVPTRTRVLATGLLTGASAPPVFTYLDGTQAAAVTTSADVPTVAGGPPAWPNTLTDPKGVGDSALLQASDIGTGQVDSPGQVRRGLVAVEVWLTFARTTDSRRVTVSQRVTLPNDPEVVSP